MQMICKLLSESLELNQKVNKKRKFYFMQKIYKTKARQDILRVFANNLESNLSAYDVFNYLKDEGHSINLTTVYRNIDRMVEDGTLVKQNDQNAQSAVYRYTQQGRCTSHLHMQCIECGKVIHLECDFMSEIKEHLLSQHGFEIQCKSSILYGMCKECRNNK